MVTIEELNSGQVSTEGRICKVHGEKVRYYCETEEKQVCVDCVGLSVCPPDHKRLTLKEATKKQITSINELVKKCDDNQRVFEKAIKETDSVMNNVFDAVKQTKSELTKLKKQYIQKVEQVFDKQIDETENVRKERVKNLEDKKKSLVSDINKMKEAKQKTTDLSMTKSEFLITYNYPSMSKALHELSKAKPKAAEKSLGFLRFESLPADIPSPGYLVKREGWKLARTFPIKLKDPLGIAINHDGDIAVTSFVKGVKVFSKTGQVKYSFMKDCTMVTDIAVTHDNRYVVANGNDNRGIHFHTKEGRFLSSVPVSNVSGAVSNINSIAVDTRDQIIAALVGNAISIHYADGSLISNYTTDCKPLRLASTFEGDIICSFIGHQGSLKLMDYSGSNVMVLQPPSEVTEWCPCYMCCKEGEIFVSNYGEPPAVLRYTSKGQYLGCVTTEVINPQGLALSHDGMELFVVEYEDCLVKIFHRE